MAFILSMEEFTFVATENNCKLGPLFTARLCSTQLSLH